MKKLLALVLVTVMVFAAACALAEDVVLKMRDREITAAEVQKSIDDELQYLANLYAAYGYSYDATDPANIAEVREAVLNNMKQKLALTAKAAELGLDVLTDEEAATVKEQGQANFDGTVLYVKTYAVTGAEGMDDETLTQAVVAELAKMGITPEAYTEEETQKLIEEKMKAYAARDVVVTKEEVQAEYDSRVAADRSAYEGQAGLWTDAAINGTFMYYTPAGVRRVKQILTKFKEEDQAAISAAQQQLNSLAGSGSEEEIEAARKAVEDAREQAFANLDEEVDAILAALDEGADWQALMDEKNQDPGMQTYPRGYAVAAGMSRFDPAFLEAAMALEKPGDHSGKIRGTSYGYYIIRYDSDEPEGPVALDAVYNDIGAELLKTKKDEAYAAALEQWVQEAGIEEHPEVLGE